MRKAVLNSGMAVQETVLDMKEIYSSIRLYMIQNNIRCIEGPITSPMIELSKPIPTDTETRKGMLDIIEGFVNGGYLVPSVTLARAIRVTRSELELIFYKPEIRDYVRLEGLTSNSI